MTKPIDRDPIFRRRTFDADVIELCCRWYVTYRLSYRDMAAIMAERGVQVAHTTVMRWVIRYLPEFEKRWKRLAKGVNSSWRADETYIEIKGRWNYIFRAVDKHGKTIDFLLRRTRGTPAAEAFFRKALCTTGHHWPKKVDLDGHKPSHLALRYLRREDPQWVKVRVRSSQYLNNTVEQDHRSINRRVACMLGFKSFMNASIVLAGVELAHKIRKHQFSLGRGQRSWSLPLNELWRRALAY